MTGSHEPYLQEKLFLQVLLNFVVLNHALLKHVGTSLGRTDHLDHLAEIATFTSLERCNYFLCHILNVLFNFFVNSYFLQVRVVLLELQTLGCVLAVLGGNVARHSGNTTCLLLSAFEDNLNAISFSFLCHSRFVLECFNFS